mmetsp:Transcript_1430/g.4292  ORF Transcript_1430/g.4292 Transcript_1430/m.4292 type:complete len:282 (+) Transcript_1430:982-1827(+)
MDDQRRHVHLLQVFAEVGVEEGLDAVVGGLGAGLHALHVEAVDQPGRRLGAGPVEAEEGAAGDVLVELGAVVERGLAQAVEDGFRHAVGMGRAGAHDGRDGAHEHHLGHACRAMAADVAGHLAAAGGEAHQRRALHVLGAQHGVEVVGVLIHGVVGPGLTGAAVAAAVMGDDAIAAFGQELHLRFPAVGAQGPAMAEDDDRAVLRAPVLHIQRRAVVGGDEGADGGGLRCGRGGGGGRQRRQAGGGEGGGERDAGQGFHQDLQWVGGNVLRQARLCRCWAY